MFRKIIVKEPYNKNEQKPVIRCSICNGEKIAGFKNVSTGKFTEIMTIKNKKDMDFFLEKYDIDVVEIKKEW